MNLSVLLKLPGYEYEYAMNVHGEQNSDRLDDIYLVTIVNDQT
jgi:hypothetical protein